jgi:hypothetical protein
MQKRLKRIEKRDHRAKNTEHRARKSSHPATAESIPNHEILGVDGNSGTQIGLRRHAQVRVGVGYGKGPPIRGP